MLGAETADHHGAHRRLLWPAYEATPQAKVDAIIVPATRPVVYLQEAADAALRQGCPLVTLHSPGKTSASRAVSLLDTHTAVGLRIEGPDHTVVCHAFREAGGRQDTFIGGGALAVDVRRGHTFFANIYNDDWFFARDAGQRLQPVTTVGEVPQEPYDPYRPPRARAEEIGDVLDEGIFLLLDQGRSASDVRGMFAPASAAPLDVSMVIELLTHDANFQAEVSNALLRFNLRKLTWAEVCGRKILDFTASVRPSPQYEGICKLIRRDLQSLDPAELYSMLRHLGFRITPSRQYEEDKHGQRLAFLHALIRIRSQQKRGVETRSSLSSLQSEPLSRQASTRDRMTASSHSLRGPTFPAASWPTRGTAIAA